MSNFRLKTLSACNGILVRAKDEPRLLSDLCELIIEIGGYRGAWVAYAERDEGKTLLPAASAGVDAAFLTALEPTWADVPQGQGLAGRAVRTGMPQLALNLAGEVDSADRRHAIIERGYSSAIALPLSGPEGIFGVIKVYAEAREAFDKEEIALLTELADDLAFGILALRTRLERRRLAVAEHEGAERLKRALLGTIQAVALTVEKRDPYTAGHQERVARLAVAIAQELGWSADQIEGVRLGAVIHDIGKIYVPSEILSRPGKLTDLEYQLIQNHPRVGYEILEGVELPWPVADIVVQHHERLDGSGYPKGLKGDAIIPEARVLAVADVVEAMAVHRPYRPSLGVEAGLEEIQAKRGTRYDPAMVDACARVLRERGFSFDE